MAEDQDVAHRALIALAALILAGCCPKPEATRPVVVEVERRVVVPLPAELLTEQPVVSGPLSECPAVAAARKSALEQCNAQLRAIDKTQKTD